MENDDPFNLERFLRAQEDTYEEAYAEICQGRKETHWMWFVFPQMLGLGSSARAMRYGISGAAEAKAYLEHEVLGKRLRECTEALLKIQGKSARHIMGTPDDMKLKSSMALFETVAEPGSIFAQLLEKYFDGQRDVKTVQLLKG